MIHRIKPFLVGLLALIVVSAVIAQSPNDAAKGAGARIKAKVEEVKDGMKKWKASGRDPSAVMATLREKVRPLVDALKPVEAEAELDRLLEQLRQEPKPAHEPARPPSITTGAGPSFSALSPDQPLMTMGDFGMQIIFESVGSPVARIKSKMQLIKKLEPGWIKGGGDAAKLASLTEQVSQFGSKHHFAEAEKTEDQILSLLGAAYTPAENDSNEAHRKERDGFIANGKKFNTTGVEEYMSWSVTEPERGSSNWGVYREDAAAIKKAGLKLVAYLWAQALPTWVKSDPHNVFTGNIDTGLETENLSIFAPETLEAYDHFYGEASRELGDMIDFVRIGSPYDYGECAYPAGAGSPQFPKKNVGPGFWVNEAPARAHFKAAMKAKYGAIAKLNAAWGTSFVSFDAIDYPKDVKSPRWWLDFIHWYQDGFTERMGEIAAIAQKHFPKTPININLGWPFEKVSLGFDITGLTKMASARKLCLRTPTGSHVPFLFTKRVATAARYYQPARFSSEPVGASVTREDMALTYFKDLTTGVNWHMDYTANYERAQDSFAEFRQLWADAQYPQIDTALFFPTTSHFLDDWDNWRPAGFSGGFPSGLQAYAENLRDAIDYDVLDERLVSDGFLKSYRFLIWPVGHVAEADTLQKVRTWVENGGTLLVADLESIKTVEQDRGAFEDLAKLPASNGKRMVGKGSIIKIGAKVEDLASSFPAALDARDGVLISAFKDGALVFNRTDQNVVKRISIKGVSTEIPLSPLQLQWIGTDGKLADSRAAKVP